MNYLGLLVVKINSINASKFFKLFFVRFLCFWSMTPEDSSASTRSFLVLSICLLCPVDWLCHLDSLSSLERYHGPTSVGLSNTMDCISPTLSFEANGPRMPSNVRVVVSRIGNWAPSKCFDMCIASIVPFCFRTWPWLWSIRNHQKVQIVIYVITC